MHEHPFHHRLLSLPSGVNHAMLLLALSINGIGFERNHFLEQFYVGILVKQFPSQFLLFCGKINFVVVERQVQYSRERSQVSPVA